MIKRSHTPKLYFGKFTDCVRFGFSKTDTSFRSDPVIRGIKGIISHSGALHRTRLDWGFDSDRTVLATLSAYFTCTDLRDQLLSSPHADLITEIVAPASDLHRQLLLGGVEIQIRERLIYDRFRYRVEFRPGPARAWQPIIRDWVRQQFADKIRGRRGDYLVTGNWIYCLYLRTEEDLMMVKLSLEEYIHNIVRVDTFAEHGMSPT